MVYYRHFHLDIPSSILRLAITRYALQLLLCYFRTNFGGDTTSRIFENKTPIALKGENQKHVNILFGLYKLFYGAFDKTIYAFDRNAVKGAVLPNWFMTSVSAFGLGFQLLIIAAMLLLGLKANILPFFVFYTIMVFVFIGIRKFFYQELKKE